MKKSSLFFVCLSFLSCFSPSEPLKQWEAYDETPELAANATHPIARMRYKRIQSKHRDRNSLFSPFEKALSRYTQADHEAVKGLILEQDILTIQNHIAEKKLTYEALVLFYLYRIYHFETNRSTYLNALINLNPDVLKEARKKDAQRSKSNTHPLYGMPILLKDNIDALPMATTAGAAALENNFPSEDAFLVKQLKSKGGLILGKVNMSEWAYYFCQACPLGYSAMGGQTLNPYGRKTFETGGSSSGSGVAVAANYAVAAIGSETSGSILSPSGKNSVVGLKPTIGAISRSGVIPISSSMDTAGPMTKNILDNAILMSALIGEDQNDPYSYASPPIDYKQLDTAHLKGKRLGVNRNFEKDSLLQNALAIMKAHGAEIIPFDPPEIKLSNFRTLLDIDMRADLPNYLNTFAHPALGLDSIADIVAFNQKDSLLHAPYGQEIFERIAEENRTQKDFSEEKKELMLEAKAFFEEVLQQYNLDAFVSINNYSARNAAAAHYPALGVPMGYTSSGEPKNLTFIASSGSEQLLLNLGAAFERLSRSRKLPAQYH
ncbi:MAG: amidase family protein [Flavobacteriaceae bacterium]